MNLKGMTAIKYSNLEAAHLVSPDVENIELLSPVNTGYLKNKRGMGALHVAVYTGNEDQTLFYLQAGHNIQSRDKLGNTPLHYCGHREIAMVLLEFGADPQSRNNRGDTPLDLMTRRGVEGQTIALINESLNSLDNTSEEISQPLIPKMHKPATSVNYVKSLLLEFSMEIGVKRFLVLLFVVLLVSFYLTFLVTGYAKQNELKIPVMDNVNKSEL